MRSFVNVGISDDPNRCIVTFWGGAEGDCQVTENMPRKFSHLATTLIIRLPVTNQCNQAGNGIYEFTSTVHPGFAEDGPENVVELLCRGKGRSPGRPLKAINWGRKSWGHA